MTMRNKTPVRKARYIIFVIILILFVYLYKLFLEFDIVTTLDTRRAAQQQEEQSLVEALLSEKGTGCDVPSIDPFLGNPIAQFEKRSLPKPKCKGPDWVQCYLTECKVNQSVLNQTKDLECTYRDLIYINDWNTKLGQPVVLKGDKIYTLNRSDHVYIRCTAMHSHLYISLEWLGYKVGYRNLTKPEIPKSREKYPNVLLFAFDSTSRNGFIRKMPKSYKILVEKYQSVVLNKYNIVGDGTVAAVLAFLVGQTELELPELRRGFPGGQTLEDIPIIFSLLKEYGYRTAYFEDSPNTGTFQLRLKGFSRQPTDHYLYPFNKNDMSKQYCLGDRLRYSVMIDLTRQFFKLPGKKFIFTFVADITHDDASRKRWADDEFSEFLLEMFDGGLLKDTAVIVMGDHGPRFANFRKTYEGKIEERLPFISIRLPDNLHSSPANDALKFNKDVLTTPFDLHATLLHLLGLEQYRNNYKVPGADMPRGNTLLEKISPERSCGEAGVLAHWCVCLQWRRLADEHGMCKRVALAFLHYVNDLLAASSDECIPRTLKSIKWVTMKVNKNALIAFDGSSDKDGYLPKLNKSLKILQEYYQIQVELGPGSALYEATASYSTTTQKISFHERDVSRINAYGDEPKCIVHRYPHLMKYCYCKNI